MTDPIQLPDDFNHGRRRMMAVGAGAGLAAVLPAAVFGASSADAAFNALLKAHVTRGPDGVSRVRYGRFKTSGHADLKSYLKTLQAMQPSGMARSEAMAYWINLYNAKTLDVILDHYPVRSIRDINLGGGFFGSGPWKAKLLTVQGRALSLDNVEHDILRARYGDPLVHYALNCASVGCPDLQKSAWTAATLQAQFDAGARAYVNHPRGILIEDRRFTASKIYRWYRDDFGGRNGLKAHWRAYADAELAARLAKLASPKSYVYDWSLNDAI